jgi:hypothetical protein
VNHRDCRKKGRVHALREQGMHRRGEQVVTILRCTRCGATFELVVAGPVYHSNRLEEVKR